MKTKLTLFKPSVSSTMRKAIRILMSMAILASICVPGMREPRSLAYAATTGKDFPKIYVTYGKGAQTLGTWNESVLTIDGTWAYCVQVDHHFESGKSVSASDPVATGRWPQSLCTRLALIDQIASSGDLVSDAQPGSPAHKVTSRTEQYAIAQCYIWKALDDAGYSDFGWFAVAVNGDFLTGAGTDAQIRDYVDANMDQYIGHASYYDCGNAQDVACSFSLEPATGYLELRKAPSNPELVSGNDSYSLQGATYGVFADESCEGDPVAELVTDNDGYARTPSLQSGDYFVKELSASSGYELDETAYRVSVEPGETSLVNADAGHVEEAPLTGSLRLTKTSALKAITADNDCYSNEGAVFGVYADESCETELARITTEKQGSATAENLPLGKVYVKEIEAPEGMVQDTCVHSAIVVADKVAAVGEGSIADVPKSNPVDLLIAKHDGQKEYRESGNLPQGAALLENAEFTVEYFDGYYDSAEEAAKQATPMKSWVFKTDSLGQIRMDDEHLLEGDALFKDSSGEPCLPLGTVIIWESKPPVGYLPNDEKHCINITDDGSPGESVNTYSIPAVADAVKRGDLELVKVGETSMKRLAGVPFLITSQTTGESHVIVTDLNGFASTASSWNSHTFRTNENDTVRWEPDEASNTTSGQWIAPKAGAVALRDGNAMPHVNAPSIRTKGENGQDAGRLPDAIVNDWLGEGTDDEPSLEMPAAQNEDITSENDAIADDAEPADDAAPADDAPALPSDSEGFSDNTPEPEEDDEEAAIDDDDDDLDATPAENGNGESSPSADVPQPPSAGTSSPADESTAQPEQKEPENPFDPEAGIWFGLGDSGEVDIPADDSLGALPFDAYTIEELPCPSNEGLQLVKVDVIVSRDSQTVDLGTLDDPQASIRTQACDADDGDSVLPGDDNALILDKVSYANLIPGREYTMLGKLVAAETEEPITDDKGEPICADVTFSPSAPHGQVELTFAVPAQTIQKDSIAVFEQLALDGRIVASHEDASDTDQIVSVSQPAMETNARDVSDGDSTIVKSTRVEVVDQVSYRGLTPGRTYQLTGVLMDKASDAPLLIDGHDVTAEASFTPEHMSGSVDMTFAFDAASLEDGTQIVVFETLRNEGEIVASHEDLQDASQTVSVVPPKLQTSLTSQENGRKTISLGGKMRLLDTVDYSGLTVGASYELEGMLIDKTTGKPALDPAGKTITASTTLVPESSAGSAVVSFEFDGGYLGGRELVAFETLSQEGEEMAVHADLDDEAQTVLVTKPAISTQARNADDASQALPFDSSAKVTDRVRVTGVEPNREYIVVGVIMDKSTSLPLAMAQEQDNGEASKTEPIDPTRLKKLWSGLLAAAQMKAPAAGGSLELDQAVSLDFSSIGALLDDYSKEFDGMFLQAKVVKSERPSFELPMEFEIDAGDYTGQMVIFEALLETSSGKLVAVHADFSDSDQTLEVTKPAVPEPPAKPAKPSDTGSPYDKTGNLLWQYGWILALLASAGCAAGAYGMAQQASDKPNQGKTPH